jgi:hypothetical protein
VALRPERDGDDGIHPGQAGYGLIAWLVLHGGWDTWLDLGAESTGPAGCSATGLAGDIALYRE